MNAIDEARRHHLWGEEEWISIQEQLETFRMIDLMDDSLRMERAIGHATMRPMVDRPPHRSHAPDPKHGPGFFGNAFR